jgi:hypothetical protein
MPAAEHVEQRQGYHDTEQCPQLRHAMCSQQFTLGQALHHPLCETMIFNLLLGSLIEEFLYHHIVSICHSHSALNSLPFSLYLVADATSPYFPLFP